MLNLILFHCDYCKEEWFIDKHDISFCSNELNIMTTDCKICEKEYCGDCAEQHEEECK